jgi:hypothetical protein
MALKLDSISLVQEISLSKVSGVRHSIVLPSGQQMEQLSPNALVVNEDANERRTKRKCVVAIITRDHL